MPEEFDVVCLGGGVAGEAIAEGLRGSGLTLAVIERELVGEVTAEHFVARGPDRIGGVGLDGAETRVHAGRLDLDRDDHGDQVLRERAGDAADVGHRALGLLTVQVHAVGAHPLILTRSSSPVHRRDAQSPPGGHGDPLSSSAHSRSDVRLAAISRPTWTWLVPTRSAICA